MTNNIGAFPKIDTLWGGAILATLAHSIWVAQQPDFANEQSWDGFNYSVQDSQGTRGTITFAGNRVVGVFRDENSPRNPLLSDQDYDLNRFFVGINSDLLTLANEEALQYVLEEYNGSTIPIITAAFWSAGEYLTAAEPWSEVVANGAELVRIQLMNTEAAIEEWQNAYELSSSQVALMRSLFERKMTAPNAQITLSNDELNVLTANYAEGIEESCELLNDIGILLP
jgi:hypothetical protein